MATSKNMVKTTSLLTLHWYLFFGVVILRSSDVIGTDSPATPTSNISSPTSSTLINATTTPVPVVTTKPTSEYGHFNVSDGNNTCILLDISCIVSLELSNTSGVQTVMYALPKNAQSSGTCATDSSSVSLAWRQGSVNFTLTMVFKMSSDKWQSSSVSFTATTGNKLKPIIKNGTESSVTERFVDATFMSAAKGKSYKCEKAKNLAKGSVTVMLNKIQVQPFGGEFGEAEVCSAKSGDNPAEPVDTVVPIAVGCVLLGLIIILIITYFVGRCRRTGYQSM